MKKVAKRFGYVLSFSLLMSSLVVFLFIRSANQAPGNANASIGEGIASSVATDVATATGTNELTVFLISFVIFLIVSSVGFYLILKYGKVKRDRDQWVS